MSAHDTAPTPTMRGGALIVLIDAAEKVRDDWRDRAAISALIATLDVRDPATVASYWATADDAVEFADELDLLIGQMREALAYEQPVEPGE